MKAQASTPVVVTGAGLEEQILQAVPEHGEAAVLAEIAVGAVRRGDDRRLVMVLQVLADARQVGERRRCRCARKMRPPGRCRRASAASARRRSPAARITSPSAKALAAPSRPRRSTPTARPFSMRIRVAVASVISVSRPSDSTGPRKASTALQRRPLRPIDRVLQEADASLRDAVEVGRVGHAARLERLHEGAAHRAVLAEMRDLQRAVDAVQAAGRDGRCPPA